MAIARIEWQARVDAPHPIVAKDRLAENVFSFEFEARLIAAARRPGQFVLIGINREYSERVPLTIAGADPDRGTIRIVFQRVGKTTYELADREVGDAVDYIVGPLGNAITIERVGRVVCVGGGIGTAALLPIAVAMRAAGNQVLTVLGARTHDLLVLEEDFAAVSDEMLVMTDDGGYGRRGLVTVALGEICERADPPDLVVAIGPAIMMKACCDLTRKAGIPTRVSLNTIMIDGMGMCGGCRIDLDGEPKFACMDGPEFDGHKVDFDQMLARTRAYADLEHQALADYQVHRCQIGLDRNDFWPAT